MFSTRLDWTLPQNPLTKLLAQKRAGGDELLDLTESNPTAANLAYPRDTFLSAWSDPRALIYEPHPAGLTDARAAVGDYYGAEQGFEISAERVLLTASTS